MTQAPAYRYEPIVVAEQSTVVAEYVPEPVTATRYQSEADLEADLLRMLQEQAYERLTITSEADLVANLRAQLEALNDFRFSDDEWRRFFTETIASANDGIAEKTFRLQADHVQLLTRDDGSTKNVRLLDKANVHDNRLQVLNQYEAAGESASGTPRDTRYDVTILVNGLPLVHVELKRRGVDLREAFNQIERYQRDSFWSGSGLFEYVQLFVISNGTLTKYYSNTTRRQHVRSQVGSAGSRRGGAKSSHSYEFTSWWADAANRPIQDLGGFTRTFFAKHTLLAVLLRYCVLTADQTLLVMRPYQIVATERILQRIETATNARRLGTVDAGGYVWHTTGSGKTLTSFKTAQLAAAMPSVDKVLFVVDRKDLDYQTMREYDRFEKGAANSNTSTAMLARQLGDPDARIIITTIQKLSTFIDRNRGHAIYDGHVVLVFDECHRSQFGDMHTRITKAFRKYHLFGFTGTPIMPENAGTSGKVTLRTTEQAFGDRLHTYTIVDAITDGNVLPFKVDYVNTVAVKEGLVDKQVAAIDAEAALLDPRRLREITTYVLDHFDQKTKRTGAATYAMQRVLNVAEVATSRRGVETLKAKQRVSGFNAIFATASIPAARQYYNEFRRQMEDRPPAQRLKVALIYSYAANEQDPDGTGPDGSLAEEDFDPVAGLDKTSRDFLEDAIQDYNDSFGTSYDTTAEKFQNYYKDLSLRLKSREVDLVIVVNMFLTGFDATTLNTLFVDKNLRAHGLIQAYSRTNRILNSVKTYGQIVSFRNLETATNDAIALFGNREAGGTVLLRPYAEYLGQYAEKITELRTRFPAGERIVGEEAEKEFIALFGAVLRLRNILTSFDEFVPSPDGPGDGAAYLSERALQDYQSVYLDLHAKYRAQREAAKESIADDVVFEIELMKQVEINVDYILMLVEQRRAATGEGEDQEIRAQISRAVDASPTLRNKKDLIEAFVDKVSLDDDVAQSWRAHVAARRDAELAELIDAERLQPEPTREFVAGALRDGVVRVEGTAIARLLPPVSRFSADAGRATLKARVVMRLRAFVDRFCDL